MPFPSTIVSSSDTLCVRLGHAPLVHVFRLTDDLVCFSARGRRIDVLTQLPALEALAAKQR